MIEMPVRPDAGFSDAPGNPNNSPVINPGFNPRLLGLLTDYDTLCAPYVQDVRDVLTGRQYRFKVNYNDSIFHFYHGCLMVQVLHDGMLRAMPPFGKAADGKPYLQSLPEHQLQWFDDFLTLPKTTLLFYFSLMKEVFKGEPLRFRWEDPKTGRVEWVDAPVALKPFLSEVGWPIAKSIAA